MKKILTMLVVLGVCSMASVSFAQCCAGGAKKDAAEKVATETCPKCGELAGSEKCCKDGAEICAGCGLHKGSPGCVAKCAAPAKSAE